MPYPREVLAASAANGSGLPADKAYEQTIESSTAYPRQVRLSARGYWCANLPRAVLSRDSPVDQRIDISLVVQGFHRPVDFAVAGFGIGKCLMGQIMRLEIAPDNLDVIEFRRVLGSHSTVSQCLRASSAARAILLTWIGPLSSTSTTGFVTRPGLGPKRRSSCC